MSVPFNRGRNQAEIEKGKKELEKHKSPDCSRSKAAESDRTKTYPKKAICQKSTELPIQVIANPVHQTSWQTGSKSTERQTVLSELSLEEKDCLHLKPKKDLDIGQKDEKYVNSEKSSTCTKLCRDKKSETLELAEGRCDVLQTDKDEIRRNKKTNKPELLKTESHSEDVTLKKDPLGDIILETRKDDSFVETETLKSARLSDEGSLLDKSSIKYFSEMKLKNNDETDLLAEETEIQNKEERKKNESVSEAEKITMISRIESESSDLIDISNLSICETNNMDGISDEISDGEMSSNQKIVTIVESNCSTIDNYPNYKTTVEDKNSDVKGTENVNTGTYPEVSNTVDKNLCLNLDCAGIKCMKIND